MKHFWALPAALQLTIVLAAQRNPFSIHDDLLAYPQFEIQYADGYVEDAIARAKLHQRQPKPDPRSDSVQVHSGQPPDSDQDPDNGAAYEEMVLDSIRYLCKIPYVAPAADSRSNSTNTTADSEDQEVELARARERGWELMAGMSGDCVFFNDGWWSYSFCYNTGVKQFHQLPHTRGVPLWPPTEDPNVPGFILGTYKKEASLEKAGTKDIAPQGELVVKGTSKYLVQQLEGGTKCDLTGNPRRVEVQFHCNPLQRQESISKLQEISTCSYLMVIQTPRLCSDVAFQPPKKEKPHAIVCQEIVKPEELDKYERDQQLIREIVDAMDKQSAEASDNTNDEKWVGGIIVGARRIVPKGVKIEKSAIVGGGKETFIATIASSDGTSLTKAELDKLKIVDQKSIADLKDQLRALAGDKGWKLNMVDTPNGRAYRGVIDEDNVKKEAPQAKDETKDDEGSTEEYFKEEL